MAVCMFANGYMYVYIQGGPMKVRTSHKV